VYSSQLFEVLYILGTEIGRIEAADLGEWMAWKVTASVKGQSIHSNAQEHSCVKTRSEGGRS
jgi:hypothetical protein